MMNIRKWGLWSSAICLATFIAYTVCFAAIYFVNPPFTWSGAEGFIRYALDNPQGFKYIAMALMIVFSLSFVVLLECLRETAEAPRRVFARMAAHFATGFAVLIGINYFVQISAVRLQIAAGDAEGIGQFVQANPNSFVSAVNLLGWTVFFGVACLLAAKALGGGRGARLAKYAFIADGAMMLASAAAYVFGFTLLLGLLMFAGLGVATMLWSAALIAYFRSKSAAEQTEG